ncbi:hypothetical protein ACRQQF_06320 [Citrobacter arsenatis]
MEKIYALQRVVYFNVHDLCLRKKQPLIFLASLMVYSAALRFDIALFH